MTCKRCNSLGHTKKTCGVALVRQDLVQNRVDIASSLLSPNRPNVPFQAIPDTASTVEGLTPVGGTELRDVDRDDVQSDNDPDPEVTNPAVQNQIVLGEVENEGNQDISEIIWSEVEIPEDINAEESSVPKFLGNSRRLGKPRVKNCHRLSPFQLYKYFFSIISQLINFLENMSENNHPVERGQSSGDQVHYCCFIS